MTDSLQEATALFERHLDQARATGPRAITARMLLQLFALRFLSEATAPEESQESWQIMLQSASADPVRVRENLGRLAARVENQYPQLEGIFTNQLLPSLVDAESLLRDWVYSLGRIRILFGSEIARFGKWFDAVMDSSLTRGTAALQSTTPRNVADLMVRLAEGTPGESFHDPCIGLGTILAAVTGRAHGNIERLALSGQDIDPSSAALARLRLFLLGARAVRIEVGDVLREPLFVQQISKKSFFPGPPVHVNGDDLETFDVVLCDPPYGQRLANIEFAHHDRYGRFRHGKPGKGSSDLAFLQHCIACLKPSGRAIVLTAHGPLFRGGGDGEIRKNLIENDLVETVIGLPSGTLSGLSTELALIVFRLGKKATRKDRILFVDASGERNSLRNPTAWEELADKIVRTSSTGKDMETFSRLVPVEEIKATGFSLQPRRYVARDKEPATSFDVRAALARAAAHEAEAANHAAQMTEALRELDVTTPWGPPTQIRERLKALTPRERQVLEAMVRGRLNKQIAAELGTVERTVKVHRARIMQKLHASSLVELVLMAQNAGIHLSGESQARTTDREHPADPLT